MTTTVAAIQSLINKINALVTDPTFVKDNATMVALLANASTQLQGGASLEGEILANIQVILDTFDAQTNTATVALNTATGNQTTLITAARDAVVVAKDALIAATETINGISVNTTSIKTTVETSGGFITELASRKSPLLARPLGFPSLQLVPESATSGYQSQNYVAAINLSILDRRTSKVWAGGIRPAGGTNVNEPRRFVCSFDIPTKQWTVHLEVYQPGAAVMPTVLMLPMARSAADNTTVIANTFINDWSMSGSFDTISPTTMLVSNSDNSFTTATTVNSTNNRPQVLGYMTYDRVNKTLVYIANTSGNWTISGAPSATSQVRELFGDGTTRQVTGNIVGPVAYMNYVLTNPERFYILSAPDLDTATTSPGLSAPRRRTALKHPGPEILQYRQGYNSSYAHNVGNEGSYKFLYGAHQHNMLLNDPRTLQYTLGHGLRTPQWVINADGSVSFQTTYYSPITETYNQPNSSATDSNSGFNLINDGYEFVTVNSLEDTVLAVGRVKPQYSEAFKTTFVQSRLGIGAYFPWCVDSVTNTVFSFCGERAAVVDSSSSTTGNPWCNQAAISVQKLV